jgi:uncharacterized repeat protein (TIGR01451 family)
VEYVVGSGLGSATCRYGFALAEGSLKGFRGAGCGRQTWKDTVLKRILALLAAMAALFLMNAPAALALSIEISIDTVVNADEGSITQLATADTPPELIGSSCVAVARAKNQPSVHRGNDLIVTSGDDSIVLSDVEREPDAVTTAEGSLTLGPVVTVSLRMGTDEVFSAGMTVVVGEECTPPTTTTIPAQLPVIQIEKTADPVEYGPEGIGYFDILVTNTGPVDLTNVRVTDDIAVAMDPDSDCPRPELPDLPVGKSFGYECSVANLDGVSPFTNEATAFGTGPDGTEVTDTDDAVVVPPVLATTITQPPVTTTPPTTLPVTGVPFEQVRGFGAAGFGALLFGIALLGVSAWIGRERIGAALAHTEVWLDLRPRDETRTFYIPIRRND